VKACVTYVRLLLSMLFMYGHLTSLRILLELNPYSDALQSGYLVCLMNDNYSTSSRRATLGLKSLDSQRLHQDVMYTYKIIFDLVDLDYSRFFTISSNETTCGHTCKLFMCHSRIDVQKYFLCNRVVKIWNSLPATSYDFASIRSFNSPIKPYRFVSICQFLPRNAL